MRYRVGLSGRRGKRLLTRGVVQFVVLEGTMAPLGEKRDTAFDAWI